MENVYKIDNERCIPREWDGCIMARKIVAALKRFPRKWDGWHG